MTTVAGGVGAGKKHLYTHHNKCIFTKPSSHIIQMYKRSTSHQCTMKQSVQWRPQQLPELVLKLKALVIGQHTEADRALVGRGDMQLMPSHIRHRVSLDHLKSMSAEQRQKAVNSCFRQTTIQSSTSTDGDLTVPLTPGAGKEPHQRKRKRANRTVTATKKCKFDTDDCASDTD